MSTSTGATGQGGGQGAQGGTQGAGTTGQGTTPSTPFMPPKPIMGDLEQVSHDQYVPYTGGVPKEDWTGLQKPNVNILPAMQRALRSGASKDRHYRTNRQSGLAKFSREGDLIKFQRDTLRHFKMYGLDTITYIPLNNSTKTEMVSIISNHSRLMSSTKEYKDQVWRNGS